MKSYFGQVDWLQGRYLLSSAVQEMPHSKNHGAACPHNWVDHEKMRKQVDQTKPILVISKIDAGSTMFKQGFRWTQYFDFDGRQKALTHMVLFSS